jgi:hypothetical protein
MTEFSTLAVIAAVAAVASALPASAQSFDPEAGTGNVVQFSYAPITSQNGQLPSGRAAATKWPRA